jgi:serine protease Do
MYDNNGFYTNEDRVNNKETTGTYSNYYNTNNSYSGSYNGSYSGRYSQPEKKKTGFGVKAVTFAVCGALFGAFAGAGFYGVNILNKQLQKEDIIVETPIVEEVIQKEPQVLYGETVVISTDVTEVVEKVMPAMVSIVNKYVEKSSFWGQTFTQEAKSSGSGIILAQDEKELLIATNYHVIENAETLEVTFIDGSTAQAQIKGKDSGMDLAVIAIPLESISSETKHAITVAALGDSEALKLGEQVIAIGNALGYGQSVTGGWVSALNREVGMEDGSKGTFIQTDAAINGGNSGGALLNMNGEVVGINSSKISGYGVEGMGYAIPISAAEPIITDLMSKETREKVTDGKVGYMGISLQTVNAEMASYFKIPTGIFVSEVEKGSPAEKAGLLPYDIITRFDGDKIDDYEDLQESLQYCAPGTKVDLVVMRQSNGVYTELKMEITLGERPQ